MAMAVSYGNFCGQLVHENRGGTKRDYVIDTQGSITAVLDGTGTAVYEAEYWPYGEVRTETGANPSPWSFVGAFGYYVDIRNQLSYIRARHYTADKAAWLSTDALWPSEPSHNYVGGRPTTFIDYTGLGAACFCNGNRGTVKGGSDAYRRCLQAACNERCLYIHRAEQLDEQCGGNILDCFFWNRSLDPCKPGDQYYDVCYGPGGNGRGQVGGSGCCVECGIRMCCSLTAGLWDVADAVWAAGLRKCKKYA